MILKGRTERLKLALFPGFVTGFDYINALIRTDLLDINSEAMYGLHQCIEYLRDRTDNAELMHRKALAQNREILAQNESLKLKLEQQRVRADIQDKLEDGRRLRRFSGFLEVGSWIVL